MINITITCEDVSEAEEILAKLKGKAAKAEDKEERRPAKDEDKEERSSRRTKDEDKKNDKGGDDDDPREKVRGLLRKYSEKTDRKTAMKVLNRYADSVDEVPKDDLEELTEKLEKLLDE